ncbi:hypothetical protein ACI3E1_03000 [Ligilactobacillus sp. LYQ139]|uniref:hypothetical protein n=1 Tax=Ligilactobacillus sp. LYQ139 TaxID=3378800 RepID=UPI0038546E08
MINRGAKYEQLVPWFLKYVGTETRPDENATTILSPQTQAKISFVETGNCEGCMVNAIKLAEEFDTHTCS